MDAYFWITLAVGLISSILCIGAAIRKLGPNDVTILSVAAVELCLIVYTVGSIVGLFAGNSPKGDPIEFWGYMVTAMVLPIGAVYWSLIERTRWSNLVLGAVGLTVIVMVARMNQIWYAPTA
ncbi:hypothetical protein [Haematomicrobium sanguinis]|uniref:hypothetical protein n=1 Tax=Haematomicrobium sanguinis TaxID=479106 RepID=UPI00047904D6|nr:hypothetical protein [Haematomicrobium sanguinis]